MITKKGGERYVNSLGEGRRLGKDESNKVADKLIENGEGETLADNLDKFEGLDEDIAKRLIEHGFGDDVLKYPEKFGLKNNK